MKKKCKGICKYNESLEIVEMYCEECKSPMGFAWFTNGKLHTCTFVQYLKYKIEIEDKLKENRNLFDANRSSLIPTCEGDEMIF